MFEETLIKGTNDSLAILGRADILKDAYLAGGTAAALQMGHRISVDLDFFTPEKSDEMPKMLKKVDWKDIKKFFESEVKKLVK